MRCGIVLARGIEVQRPQIGSLKLDRDRTIFLLQLQQWRHDFGLVLV